MIQSEFNLLNNNIQGGCINYLNEASSSAPSPETMLNDGQ